MAEKKRSHHKKKDPQNAKPVAKKIPRQDALPGMEDKPIKLIENLAFDYAELRDERVALSAKEVDLKQRLMDAMHKTGRQEYKRNGIFVKLTVGKEGIKVKVKAESEDDLPTDIELAPGPNVSAESLAVSSEA